MSEEWMVFVPAAAPRDRDDFLDWFDEQTEWDEDHAYRDPAVCAPALKAWFTEVSAAFPVLETRRRDPREAEYSLGRVMIHVVFPRPLAAEAGALVRAAAERHGLGAFDAGSDDGTLWRPGKSGRLEQH